MNRTIILIVVGALLGVFVCAPVAIGLGIWSGYVTVPVLKPLVPQAGAPPSQPATSQTSAGNPATDSQTTQKQSGNTAPPSSNVAPSYDLPPQAYVPHPSSYQETGVGEKTKTWTIPVLAGTTLVYGGYTVGNETGGVYGAMQGPTTVTLTVTDGFYSVVTSQWGQNEYCFRLGEAVKYGWARANLHPLAGWTCK